MGGVHRKDQTAYICGPLTELPKTKQAWVKQFYTELADVCEKISGVRAFVPHEHYDPVKHANFTATQVDAAEREQVCKRTSLLVVVAVAPTWGGGIEIEMANRSNVPAVIICHAGKLKNRRISRLLRGNPAVKTIITYRTKKDAVRKFGEEMTSIVGDRWVA